MARQFQLLSCDVALGGDMLNVVARGASNPVTYPEMLLLRLIHGGAQWITNIYDVGHVERDDAQERGRLVDLYGAKLVDGAFPGLSVLPNGDNRFGVAPKPVQVAPKAVEPIANPAQGNYGANAERSDEYKPSDVEDPAAALGEAPVDPRDQHVQGMPQVSDAALANPRRPKPVTPAPAAGTEG
jgi:hypothetical protein